MRNTGLHRAAKRLTALVLLSCLLAGLFCWQNGAVFSYAASQENAAETEETSGESVTDADIAAVVDRMTLDEKISQMIIPSIRAWDGTAVTDLKGAPALSEALKRHQYGGLILFDNNIHDPAQTAALTAALQENNAKSGASVSIPYFMAVDAEGGFVMRLAGGTRMPGNMAIGAAGTAEPLSLGSPGSPGRYDAYAAGAVIGEELHALGFNLDFAPDIDVNNDPSNPVIGVRSFSDDPETVALLGLCYANGLQGQGVIATVKHFPGHGDTGVDSHTGTPTIEKTYEDLLAAELIPFKAAIDGGADMIMTAHITFPEIDEPVTFADGSSGYYPATMSPQIISEILRGDLGYDGVIITDGLEMGAIEDAGLVPGSGVAYSINVAEKVILAGCDLLLLPADLNDADSAAFYDAYIAGLVEKVESGAIEESRIDESVTRILRLKEKYGILELNETAEEEADAAEGTADSADEAADSDAAEETADSERPAVTDIVGSEEHRAIEKTIALHSVTLVKNDEAIPLDAAGNIVILGRSEAEATAINTEIAALKEQGVLPEDAAITTGTYYDSSAQQYACSSDCLEALPQADAAVVFLSTTGLSSMHDASSQSQAVRAAKDSLPEGSRLIVVSGLLPYDAARYQEADAIVLAYMGAGLDTDPTGGKTGAAACNANTAAALDVIFGASPAQGTLPVAVPKISANGDGSYSYTEEILYERGFGLK
ncbi:MAG: glycoside hydrolase family 3 protein [Clostridiales bacterium]|nr:glycoside hydrolase family 3 protein [Clostridiales bacterium]